MDIKFNLTRTEKVRLTRLINEYKRKYKKNPKVEYSFYPTGIGDVVNVVFARKVNKKYIHDITDYGSW